MCADFKNCVLNLCCMPL